MRTATAYFAGVGTVVVAIAAGLGGGLVLGNIMSPQGAKTAEAPRIEQRASSQPAANGTTQPVPYMAAKQVESTIAGQPAPAQQPQQASSQQQAQPQLQQASTQSAEPARQPERSAKAEPAAVQPSPSTDPAARAAPEDSFAKAREDDAKRDARRAEDKRKAERRQRSVDRRKWRQYRDDDMRDVEAAVREDSEQRSFFGRPERREPRQLFGREPSFGSGRMTQFDD